MDQEPGSDRDDESLATMDVLGYEGVNLDAAPSTCTVAGRRRASEAQSPDSDSPPTPAPPSSASQPSPPQQEAPIYPTSSYHGNNLRSVRSITFAVESRGIGPPPTQQLPPVPSRADHRRRARLALAAVATIPHSSSLPSANSPAVDHHSTQAESSLSIHRKSSRSIGRLHGPSLEASASDPPWTGSDATSPSPHDSAHDVPQPRVTSRTHPFDSPSPTAESPLTASLLKTAEAREKRFRQIRRDATKGTWCSHSPPRRSSPASQSFAWRLS